MRETVLVTEIEFAKGRLVFRAQDDLAVECAPREEQALARLVAEKRSRAVIVGVSPYQGPLYEALAEAAGLRGAVISRFGVGHDNIVKPLARRRNIVVTNTPGVLDVSVAEHAMWLIGSLARAIPRLDRSLRRGGFRPEAGVEVRGKTLGLVGFGTIARGVAAMARFGFGMNVMAAGRRSAAQLSADEGRDIEVIQQTHGLSAYTNDLAAVLGRADVVSLHMPASPENHGFFDAEKLAAMKPDAFLVNTSRGAVLDESALYDALASGRLAAAALDVFQEEPYRPVLPDKDLRALDNVVLTPHVASSTREANAAMARASIENVRLFFAGRMSELSAVS